MNESESKNEKPKEERTFDPELLKKGLRCDLDQYEMLKRCSDAKDMTEWNEWRRKNPDKDIFLEGAKLSHRPLKGVLLNAGVLQDLNTGEITSFHGEVHLGDSYFFEAYLEDADFRYANLKGANLRNTNLKGARLNHAHLEGASFRTAITDGFSQIWYPEVNRYYKNGRYTDFRGVGLGSVRIDPGTKQLLEYNIRLMNWEEWYKEHRLLHCPVWLFWLISDYGLRTWRVIATFFGLAIAFAVVYWLCPTFVMVNQVVGDIRGFWHALYFSVVTMTTLGFGDIAANPDSWGGQTLLMLQVILGYVLLGALVTRFAVLFTAGGPAGKFSNEQGKKGQGE